MAKCVVNLSEVDSEMKNTPLTKALGEFMDHLCTVKLGHVNSTAGCVDTSGTEQRLDVYNCLYRTQHRHRHPLHHLILVATVQSPGVMLQKQC